MEYEQALSYIHGIPKFRRPLGNANLSRLLELMGRPQDVVKFIHIAGTNGKGSAAAMTARILTESGYRTGLFTSPYIIRFNERIRTDGKQIMDEELAEYTSYAKKIMTQNDVPVSEFAFITAVALRYFADRSCDMAVLEAGMGGRLDATNVIDQSEVSVITSISLDHTQYLGDTIEKIAYEKCGIIKKGGIVISAPNAPVRGVIEKAAQKQEARLVFAEIPVHTDNGMVYKGTEYELGLKGAYQLQNASVVLETVSALRTKGYEINDKAVRRGLKNTIWRARFEKVNDRLIVDGAHNIDAMKNLRSSLEEQSAPVTLVMAMMKDKSCEDCVREIVGAAERVITCGLNMERCLGAEELCALVRKAGAECEPASGVGEAVDRAVRIACRENGVVCVCGSLYLAGEVLKYKGE